MWGLPRQTEDLPLRVSSVFDLEKRLLAGVIQGPHGPRGQVLPWRWGLFLDGTVYHQPA